MRPLKLSILSCALLAAGCATPYVTPGGAVSIPAITESGVAEALAREPAAPFPARIAVVRVQAANYHSRSGSYGEGNFSVITGRDFETEADLARIAKMPGVAGVGMMSRLLMPSHLSSAADVRSAAAQLRADIVLLYSMDTSFRTDTTQIGPLQLVSLGFFPNKKAKVQSTCAAAFIDTRTGYIYGVAEWTASEEQRSDLWNKEEALEKARGRAERAAFAGAVDEIEKTWVLIVAEYQKPRGSGALANPAP